MIVALFLISVPVSAAYLGQIEPDPIVYGVSTGYGYSSPSVLNTNRDAYCHAFFGASYHYSTAWWQSNPTGRYQDSTNSNPSWYLGATENHMMFIFGCQNSGGDYYSIQTNHGSRTISPQGNFVATPVSGSSPLSVNFRTVNISNFTGISWAFGDGQLSSTNSNNFTYTYNNPGTYSVGLNYYFYNGTASYISKPNYITVTPQTGLHLIVNVRDADTGYEISNSTVGIKNTTSNLWWNLSTPTGGAFFQSTDVQGVYSLSANQTVKVGATSYGYTANSQDVLILNDNQVSDLYLTKTSQTPTNGNWNLLVKLVRNLDGQPVCSATVKVITGVNGPGVYEGSPVCSTGVVSFFNISASASASIEVIAQGYKSAGAFTPVVPNSTQQITIQMVRIYDTPVATPIPVTTTSAGLTGQPTPQITDASGNPITSSEGKATWSLDQLFNILPQIVMIVCSLIFAWLFWRGVDIVTNGMATLIMRRVIEGFLKGMFK